MRPSGSLHCRACAPTRKASRGMWRCSAPQSGRGARPKMTAPAGAGLAPSQGCQERAVRATSSRRAGCRRRSRARETNLQVAPRRSGRGGAPGAATRSLLVCRQPARDAPARPLRPRPARRGARGARGGAGMAPATLLEVGRAGGAARRARRAGGAAGPKREVRRWSLRRWRALTRARTRFRERRGRSRRRRRRGQRALSAAADVARAALALALPRARA